MKGSAFSFKVVGGAFAALVASGCGGVGFNGQSLGRTSSTPGSTSGGESSETGTATEAAPEDDDDDTAGPPAAEAADITGAFLTCGVVDNIEVEAAVDQSAFGCTAFTKDKKPVEDGGFEVKWRLKDAADAAVAFTKPSKKVSDWTFAAVIFSSVIPDAQVIADISVKGEKMVAKSLSQELADLFSVDTPSLTGPYVTGMETLESDPDGDMSLMGKIDGKFQATFDWRTGVFSLGPNTSQFTIFRLPLKITLSDGSTVSRTVNFDVAKDKAEGLDLSDLDWTHVRGLDPTAVQFQFMIRNDQGKVSKTKTPYIPTTDAATLDKLVINGDDDAPRGWVGIHAKFILDTE